MAISESLQFLPNFSIPRRAVPAAMPEASPADNLTFVINGWNTPFTPTGFAEWFGKAAKAAGLPTGYTAHGLRKGCAKRLADQGCTVTEIAAITGHKTLKEVER